MGITVEVKWIPDGKEEVCRKVLFNVCGCNVIADKLTWFNIDGSPIFSIMVSELVSVDYEDFR